MLAGSVAAAVQRPEACPPIEAGDTHGLHTAAGPAFSNTLAELAESLAAVLRRPVAIATLSGQLLAGCDPTLDGAAGKLSSFWRAGVRLLNSRQFGVLPSRSAKTLRLSPDDGGPVAAPQIACPIRSGGSVVAAVFVSEGAARLSTIFVHQTEHTALAAGLFLEQRQKCLELERNVGAMLLHELLNARFQSDSHHVSLAGSINLLMDKEYRVVMLNCHGGRLPTTAVAGGITDQVLSLLAEYAAPRAVCSTDARCAFLLPAHADVARFWTALAQPTISLVVGAPVRGAQAIAASFIDVQSLCTDAEPGLLHTQGRLLLPSVLRGDRAAQQAFVEGIFGKLSKLRGGKSLVRSLATFARLGFHQGRAARALYVHPNTLRYRIDRISETLGLDLLDADVRFRVQLASHLWALDCERAALTDAHAAQQASP